MDKLLHKALQLLPLWILITINVYAIIRIIGLGEMNLPVEHGAGAMMIVAAVLGSIAALVVGNLIYLGVWANITGKLTLRALSCPHCGKKIIERVKAKRWFQRKDKITCECGAQIELARDILGFSIKDWKLPEQGV